MTNQITVTIKNNSYIVKYPTVGQFLVIETLKQALSNGQYDSLMKANTYEASMAFELINVEAFITTMIPKLVEDLKVSSIRDLGLKDMLEIRQVYMDQIYPFTEDIRKLCKDVFTNKIANDTE